MRLGRSRSKKRSAREREEKEHESNRETLWLPTWGERTCLEGTKGGREPAGVGYG